MRTHLLIVGFAAAITLAGCGTNPGDRAASGALIGAAGGAALGAMAGNPGLGAAVGAGAGAVVGAATDPCDLNLGTPPGRMTVARMSAVAAAPIATADPKG